MRRTQVQLTDEQREALRRLAIDRGVSMSALVRESVDMLLHAQGEDAAEARWQKAAAAIGRVRSGVRDVSARHDDYLAEAYSGKRERLR